jgi:methylmalonyl-CoA mutase
MDLFKDFKATDYAQWEAAVLQELKGEAVDKLRTTTEDGLQLSPYYTAADLPAGFAQHLPGDMPYRRGLRANHNDWVLFERFTLGAAEATNKAVLHALMHGTEGIIFDGAITEPQQFGQLTEELLPQYLILCFRQTDPVPLAGWLKAWADRLELPTLAIRGSAGYDPLGAACFGDAIRQLPLGALVKQYQQNLPAFLPLSANAARFREQGASLVQELGIALALGNAYLKRLLEDGLTIDEATPALQFELAVGTDYFAEIVKFRAFRQLWSGLVAAYSPEHSCSTAAHVLASASGTTLSAIDPHTNLLRLTTAAMSAVLGGVHGLELRAFDEPVNGGSGFGAELSRNIQLLLKNEAYLDSVVDPAAGSYYLESLTDQLSDQAWAFFQSIEAQGGFEAAWQKGWLPEQLKKQREQLTAAVASRKKILVGVNQYPDQQHVDVNSWPSDSFRLSADFEALRKQTAAAISRPKVFLLPMGDLAMRLARATFIANFFSCAGYEIIENNGFEHLEEGTQAALRSGAEVVVLCASDTDYPALVPAFCQLLQGKTELVLAGYPQADIEAFTAAGIQHFIHVRSPLLATLQAFQNRILS